MNQNNCEQNKESESCRLSAAEALTRLYTEKSTDSKTMKQTNVLSRTSLQNDGCNVEADDISLTFPQKLMLILSDGKNANSIAWLPDGMAFSIFDRKKLSDEILPRYFQSSSKYTSFTRRLNRWGFTCFTRGVGVCIFYHKMFQRNDPFLCTKIVCKKTSKLVKPSKDNRNQRNSQIHSSSLSTTPLNAFHGSSTMDPYSDHTNIPQMDDSLFGSVRHLQTSFGLGMRVGPQELDMNLRSPSLGSPLLDTNAGAISDTYLINAIQNEALLASAQSLLSKSENECDKAMQPSTSFAHLCNPHAFALKEASQILMSSGHHRLPYQPANMYWDNNSLRQAILLSNSINGRHMLGHQRTNLARFSNAHAA